jgi:hypothetical protein
MMPRRRPILSVALDGLGHEAAPHRVALASLPLHYRSVDVDPVPDVRVVAGTPEVWPALAEEALERGPRAVVIASRAPAPEADAARLMARASSVGVVVALATPFAGVRAWRAALGRIARDARSASCIDSVMTWSEDQAAARALLDQLAVVSGVVPDIAGLRIGRAGPDHYVVAGRAGGIAVVLSGSRCRADAPRLRLDLAGTPRRWHASFDGTAPARPSVIERCSGDRNVSQPPDYESGYRALWVDLYERLAGRVPLPAYLSLDGRQLALCRRLVEAIDAR